MSTAVWGAVVVFALLLIVVVLLLVLRKPPDISVLLGPLSTLTQTLGALQSDLRGLGERIATVERDQGRAGVQMTALENRLAETGSVAQGLVETAASIRSGLGAAQETLVSLHSQAKARQHLEERTADSIRRLEAVLAGTHSKGAAGENIVEQVFSQLPPQWQARNVQVGNKTVEFGLRLPNGLILPIDSKWTATHLLEAFQASEDVEEQRQIKGQMERAVLAKAREVRKYIDPSVTVPFGVAAVPDAVFDLSAAAQVEALQMNVAIVGYSLFIPYLLLVFQTLLKSGRDIDLEKLAAYLETVQQDMGTLQEELEGRLSKAITMLGNSRDEMRVRLSRVAVGLAALSVHPETPAAAVRTDDPPLEPGNSD